MDTPKSLGISHVREARLKDLRLPHSAPLVNFVESLRARTGRGTSIPYFDPHDGGTNAECLLLLEAPGKKAVESQFISRNNPDETAKNLWLFTESSG